jgi:hypothetical protein
MEATAAIVKKEIMLSSCTPDAVRNYTDSKAGTDKVVSAG